MTPSIQTIPLSDGYPCRAAVYLPTGESAAGASRRLPVLYLHGIQSHGGWFSRSVSMLAEAGHVVLMPDRRGSGANPGPSGHARSLGQLLDDGRMYLERAAELGKAYPQITQISQMGSKGPGGMAAPLAAMSSQSGCPPQHACDKKAVTGMAPMQKKNESVESAKSADKVHLLGVSWGGKWALALAAKYPERVASLTLSTPGLYAQRTVNFAKRLAIACCAIGWPTRRFAIPLNEPELFTDVDRWKKFIADDPLRLRSASARFLAVSQWMEHLLPRWAAAVQCPTLLLLADGDPIVDNQRVAALLTSRLPADRLTVRRFPSAVHTLEFTTDPSPYFQTLVEWMDQERFAR